MAVNFNGKTILIAEDNRDSRVMLRVFLENQGYRVVEAENGREAVSFAVAKTPDLILIDLNMPEINGIAATEKIRQNSDLRDVPIIANSADGQHGMDLFLKMGSFGKGFITYLTKPIDLGELQEQIESALTGSGAAKTA